MLTACGHIILRPFFFKKAGNHTKYMFRTDDEGNMREWITCISANVQKDNAFAALYMKKMSTVQGINLGSGGSSA